MLKAMMQAQGVFAELDKSMLIARLRKAREDRRLFRTDLGAIDYGVSDLC